MNTNSTTLLNSISPTPSHMSAYLLPVYPSLPSFLIHSSPPATLTKLTALLHPTTSLLNRMCCGHVWRQLVCWRPHLRLKISSHRLLFLDFPLFLHILAPSDTFWLIVNIYFRLVDVGGQRSERRKWIHVCLFLSSIPFHHLTLALVLWGCHSHHLLRCHQWISF